MFIVVLENEFVWFFLKLRIMDVVDIFIGVLFFIKFFWKIFLSFEYIVFVVFCIFVVYIIKLKINC